MFDELVEIYTKPNKFEFSNSTELWNNPHISKQMLKFHLDPNIDPASRNKLFIDKSFKWIVKKLNINSQSKILDLGCGPGLYTIRFAKIGAKVTGIDVSTNSIEYARNIMKEENLNINYINDNYINCDFNGKFDLITIIYNDFCVLNSNDRKILLNKIYDSLEDNGIFLFDVHSDAHFDSIDEEHTTYHLQNGDFWSPNEHFVFEHIYKYNDSKLILEKNTIIEKSKKFHIYNYLQCFTLDEIIEELTNNKLEVLEYFSDISGKKYEKNSKDIALICKK